MNPTITTLRQSLKRKKLDAICISNPANVSYLSGFKGDDSFLLIDKDKEALFITDFRYLQQAKNEVKDFKILMFSPPLINKIPKLTKKHHLKKIGFEAAHLNFDNVRKLNIKRECKFISTDGLIERFRLNKTKPEIKVIKKSADIAVSALKKTINYIKVGMMELEVAGYLEWRMRKQGAERIAFPTIVASGINSSMPHAISSNKKIKKNEPIIIDCGCVFFGYNSDLTRTIFLGRIDAQFRHIYSIIREAQQKAISNIRPGVKVSSIDKVARDYIRRKGFGKYFGHATGHGIGRKVHEAPIISSKSGKALKPGMVFTVEPGVYIPGWGGIRIEDMVLVTDKSYKILTHDKYKSI
ncbi:MAG: aminopeptidase P family protein [Candidatus Omnitrophota bacterium]|nr:MAG: aminopeptidase P family protein [Candidatus Omnitrophota bacterium]